MVHLGEVSPTVWDTVVEYMEFALEDNEFSEDEILPDWRKDANRRKFDRELFERYGYFKDIILHPKFQFIKQYLQDHADFNFFVGEPILTVANGVIILFMLHRRVSYGILGLCAAFLFNINPLYVVMIYLALLAFTSTKKPKQFKNLRSYQIVKNSIYLPTLLHEETSLKNDYDHVLIGNDIGTLYAAALLSRNGHSCCVIQPFDGAKDEIFPEGAPCSVPLKDYSVGKVERYQTLLDVGQSLSPETRVVFTPVGTPETGFTSSFIRLRPPASGFSWLQKNLGSVSANEKTGKTVCLRAGENSFAYDLYSQFRLINKSTLTKFLNQAMTTLPFLTSFLLSRASPAEKWEQTTLAKSDGTIQFNELLSRSAEDFIYSSEIDDPAAKETLSAIAAAASGQGLVAANCSAFSLANYIQTARGIFYPEGGPSALRKSLTRTIRSAGGCVLKNIALKEVLLEESAGKTVCVGVSVSNAPENLDKTLKNPDLNNTEKEITIKAEKSVISGMGVLPTYLKIIPLELISNQTKEQLSVLTEARPTISVVYWFNGSIESLGFSPAEYVELTEQPKTVLSGVNEINLGLEGFAASYARVWSPSAKDPTWKEKNPSMQVLIVEFSAVSPLVESKEMPMPIPDSPEDDFKPVKNGPEGPSIYYSDHPSDNKTNPINPEYNSFFSHPVTLSKSRKEKFKQRADELLLELYPEVSTNVQFYHVEGPVVGGQGLACNSSKFVSKINAHTEVERLFLSGVDLGTSGLAGELQGAWVAVNAALGYTAEEMANNRNIVTDLNKTTRRF